MPIKASTSCVNCGESFVGRKNQRFCSSKCRISFNNSKIRDAREPITDINKILYKNRSILKELFERFESTSLNKEVLNRSDYNKRYYTHHTRNQQNELYTWCYDFGWIIAGEDDIQIVKSKT